MQPGATYSPFRAGALIGTYTGREIERQAGTGELEPGDEVEQPGVAGRRRIDEGLVLAGKRIRMPVSVRTLKAVLGPPDRSVALANTIYTWDDLSITASEKPGSGAVSSIAFNFRPESFQLVLQEIPWVGGAARANRAA